MNKNLLDLYGLIFNILMLNQNVKVLKVYLLLRYKKLKLENNLQNFVRSTTHLFKE